jgi:hypothetical protein
MTTKTALIVSILIIIVILMLFMTGVVTMPSSTPTSTGFATTSWLGTIKTVTGF